MKLYHYVAPASSTYMVAPVPQEARELVFSRSGTQVTATLDGRLVEVKATGPPATQGILVFYVSNGALRIKSIEFRDIKR